MRRFADQVERDDERSEASSEPYPESTRGLAESVVIVIDTSCMTLQRDNEILAGAVDVLNEMMAECKSFGKGVISSRSRGVGRGTGFSFGMAFSGFNTEAIWFLIRD